MSCERNTVLATSGAGNRFVYIDINNVKENKLNTIAPKTVFQLQKIIDIIMPHSGFGHKQTRLELLYLKTIRK
jgi:hypothetical protein